MTGDSTDATPLRRMTDEEKAERCRRCGHERAVHAGHDGLGRCCLRSCGCHDSAFLRT